MNKYESSPLASSSSSSSLIVDLLDIRQPFAKQVVAQVNDVSVRKERYGTDA